MRPNVSTHGGAWVSGVLGAIACAVTIVTAQPNGVAAKFGATTVNMSPGAGETLSIEVIRWSTDAERDRLVPLLTGKPDAKLPDTLQASPTVGYVWTTASIGYALKYAQRMSSPDGKDRVVLATDRPLGAWDRTGNWKAAGQASATEHPFTVLELRVARSGVGEGKMSIGAEIVAEPDAKTVVLADYDAAPVLLKGVRNGDAAPAASKSGPRPKTTPKGGK